MYKLINVFQDNFPELLRRAIIIRAPWLFYGMWKLVKPALDPRVREKISIVREDYEEEIQKFLERDQIPKFLGGDWVTEDTEGNLDPECQRQSTPQNGYGAGG